MASALSNLFAVLSLDTQSYLDSLNKTKKKTDSFLATFSNVGGAVAAGIATAGIAAVGFLASTIEPASNLNETISKTNIVFGDSAKEILDWSKTSSTALGMSQNSALSAAATYGNLFRAMDISEESSAKMSTGLVTLAGDLASFNNMDPTDVLDKLRAGLSGETEPLKSLGVNINEALIKQKALELGLWDGVGALDASQKAQASYALIMEQTALAQGDFARTSDGLANQQRILEAQWEDIKSTLGTALLPLLTELGSTLSETLAKPETQATIERITAALGQFAQDAVEFIPPAILAIQNGFNWLKENEGVVIAIFAALGVAAIAWGVVTAAAAWSALAPLLPVIAVILLIAAAAYIGYQAWTTNFGGIQEKTQAVISFVKGLIRSGMQFITDIVEGRMGLLSLIFTTVWSNIQLLFAAFKAAFSGDWHRFGELLRSVWDNNWTMIRTVLTDAWTNIQNAVRNGITAAVDLFTKTNWSEVGRNILQGIANGIKNAISIITNAARNAASAALEAAKGFLGIQSPSSVFEMEVGWQMAAGAAAGWQSGLDRMFTPAPLAPSALSLRGAGTAVGGGRDEATSENARRGDVFDYERLGRVIVEALMKRGQ